MFGRRKRRRTEREAGSSDRGIRLQIDLYDDARAIVGDAAIESLNDVLLRWPGIDDVAWVDREVFHVGGSLSAEQLRAVVIAELAASGDPSYWEDEGRPAPYTVSEAVTLTIPSVVPDDWRAFDEQLGDRGQVARDLDAEPDFSVGEIDG